MTSKQPAKDMGMDMRNHTAAPFGAAAAKKVTPFLSGQKPSFQNGSLGHSGNEERSRLISRITRLQARISERVPEMSMTEAQSPWSQVSSAQECVPADFSIEILERKTPPKLTEPQTRARTLSPLPRLTLDVSLKSAHSCVAASSTQASRQGQSLGVGLAAHALVDTDAMRQSDIIRTRACCMENSPFT